MFRMKLWGSTLPSPAATVAVPQTTIPTTLPTTLTSADTSLSNTSTSSTTVDVKSLTNIHDMAKALANERDNINADTSLINKNTPTMAASVTAGVPCPAGPPGTKGVPGAESKVPFSIKTLFQSCTHVITCQKTRISTFPVDGREYRIKTLTICATNYHPTTIRLERLEKGTGNTLETLAEIELPEQNENTSYNVYTLSEFKNLPAEMTSFNVSSCQEDGTDILNSECGYVYAIEVELEKLEKVEK